MNLETLNNDIDRILWDMIGNDYFNQDDLPNIVNSITEVMIHLNSKLDPEKLKIYINFLIEAKHDKYYVYDLNSDLNKVRQQPKSDDDIMSFNESDFENNSTGYFNSEVTDKISLSCALDLICHRYEYSSSDFTEDKYKKRAKRLSIIKKLPQFQQKSKEWFDQRNNCLTATAVAIVLDEDPYKYPIELLFEKCGKGKDFKENKNVHHGKKYEQIGCLFYSFRNNIKLGEYGLIQSEQYPFIAASPDNISDKYTLESSKLSKLVGRLLEIKFPLIRKILTEGDLDGEICPHYYFVQCQTQMFVTGLDECDFLQCACEEYGTYEEFVKDSNSNIPGLSKKTNLEKGCIIQLLPKKMVDSNLPIWDRNPKYLYPPRLHMTLQETRDWIAEEMINFSSNDLSEEYVIDKIIYWRLTKVACNLIKADTEWFMSMMPVLKQFWNYVLFYRKYPAKLNKLISFVDEVGVENSAEIFAKINKDYLSVKKTSYEPLYQQPSEWRIKYNNKKKNYSRYSKTSN